MILKKFWSFDFGLAALCVVTFVRRFAVYQTCSIFHNAFAEVFKGYGILIRIKNFAEFFGFGNTELPEFVFVIYCTVKEYMLW